MNSIRHQLTRSLLITLVLLLGGGHAVIYFLVREELIEGFDRTLQARAEAISTLVTVEGGVATINFNDRSMPGFDGGEAKQFFEIWNEQGISVKTSASLGTGHLPNRVGEFKRPEVWNLEVPPQQPGRAYGVEFFPRDTGKEAVKPVCYHLVVAARTKDLNEDFGEILLTVGLSGGILLGLTVMVVPFVLRRGLRPMERLADEVEKINADTLMLRLPADNVPRELQVITTRLNALFARLEASFERERRVSGAMAHELRTPIAELRNLAECALKWPESRDAETDREALAIARQMEAVVTHLLTLVRSEAGQLQPNWEIVDLAEAVNQAWKPMASHATKKNCPTNFTLPTMTAKADPVLVRSILGNLLENAVEYCPAGSVIAVRMEGGADDFTLEVVNFAPELAPGDVTRFFERFWRKDAARSNGRHAGLGLSLARAFAGALGWKIAARLDLAGRLVVAISGSRNAVLT